MANIKNSSQGWTIYISDEKCEIRDNAYRGNITKYQGSELDYSIEGSYPAKKYSLPENEADDLQAIANSEYKFIGWYINNKCVSTEEILYEQSLAFDISVETTIFAAFKSMSDTQVKVNISLVNSNITGVQTNNTYYFGHTRINRLLGYGPNAETSHTMMFITNCINDLENEKRIFGRIIEKVIKYVCSNNRKEKFTDEDINYCFHLRFLNIDTIMHCLRRQVQNIDNWYSELAIS